jgi:hypothetical protein
VNLGQRLTTLLQVVVASVDVGPHRERGVIVACPLADDGDRDAGPFISDAAVCRRS